MHKYLITKTLKTAFLSTALLALSACNGFFEKDNTPTPTPLTSIAQEVKPHLLWSAHAGSGAGDEYLKMSPVISDNAIYTTSTNGIVTALDKTTGRINWQVNTRLPITAAPGVGDQLVVVT